MKRLLVLAMFAALALPALAYADGPTFSGYIWKGNNDTTYLTVRPQSDLESWWFQIPDGEYFWVKTFNAAGDELEDTDLSDHRSITLVGGSGQRVKFAIYEVSGGGEWTATRGSSRSSTNDDVVLGTVSSGGSELPSGDNVAPGGVVASGSLSDGESSTFTYVAQNDSEDLVFSYPSHATFHVKTYNRNGDLLHDYDLDNGEVITLTGGGKFSFKVYCTKGGGDWSARRGQ